MAYFTTDNHPKPKFQMRTQVLVKQKNSTETSLYNHQYSVSLTELPSYKLFNKVLVSDQILFHLSLLTCLVPKARNLACPFFHHRLPF